MEALKRKQPDLFEEFGLQVSHGEVEVGGTYPIFGMITKVLDETPGSVSVEINFNIKARMSIQDADQINVLKDRAFETGIFVSQVTRKEPSIEVDCRTVIFGKKQGYQA